MRKETRRRLLGKGNERAERKRMIDARRGGGEDGESQASKQAKPAHVTERHLRAD